MITKRAKWIIVNQYENAESDMYKLRKAMLRELTEELGLDMDKLIKEVNRDE